MLLQAAEYLKKTFKLVCVIAALMLFMRTFIIEPGRVNGRSMENTLRDNNIFLVNKFSLLFRSPERGDIVNIHDPATGKLLVKRIIGLPGEKIKISQNSVYSIDAMGNEKIIDEPYLKPYTITRSVEDGSILYDTIPSDEYFVMGDNRPLSIDSRNYGPVHRTKILGLVITLPF